MIDNANIDILNEIRKLLRVSSLPYFFFNKTISMRYFRFKMAQQRVVAINQNPPQLLKLK